ncbi:MAG: HlyD family efflux transporter periplasmic adaptor subunit [Bacteroidales bacterium]|nr:HlyD family efflux transporter periplasmic adaptor subunit [Bacteroidales bacterium]
MKRMMIYIAAAIGLTACNGKNDFDASGSFEATEITVSAEGTGRILRFDIAEGMTVNAGEVVGTIDSLQLHLQRQQLKAQQAALLNSRPDMQTQAAALREQIAKQKTERTRVRNLLKEGAASQKQADDIDAQIRILESQLSATLSTLGNNTATINENAAALDAQIAALDDRIAKCGIVAPESGTVLVKYAEAGEMTAAGRPLFKMADLAHMYLRAYFTSDQLASLKLGDPVTVTADFGGKERYEYEGRIAWIASESEFTPKTVQTKNSRANLVYAVKIAVKNDGRLKIGLYGEVKL